MDPKHLYVDERLKNRCAYCASLPDTKDHVPPKIFLDEPLPIGGFTVEACTACNLDTSKDEEYLACFIECVISGTSNPEEVGRKKVRASLEHSPSLQIKISQSFNGTHWLPEYDRVSRVVTKLAQGHVAFEFSECALGAPAFIETVPYHLLSDQSRTDFEAAGVGEMAIWPEIGSRGFLRAAGAHPFQDDPGPWVEVQKGRYRYSVILEPQLTVRILISEYLACIVQW